MSYFFMIFIADIPVVEPLNPTSKIVYFYTMRIELVLKRSLFFLIIEKCGNDIVCFSFVYQMRIITIIRDHFDKWSKKKNIYIYKEKKKKTKKEKKKKRKGMIIEQNRYFYDLNVRIIPMKRYQIFY